MKLFSSPRILLLYKMSTYAYYLASPRRQRGKPEVPPLVKNMERFKKTHLQHYKTLVHVERFLKDRGVKYARSQRGKRIDFSKFDFVITVGGDGTFLEAARSCTKQVILGINSDPEWSVGRFCAANDRTFPKLVDAMLAQKCRIRELNRLKLQVSIPGKSVFFGKRDFPKANILNDVLVCHGNPAAMSRYWLEVDGKKEEQRSSGVWISTAAGSSGAIHSAGGDPLPFFSDRWQYRPRELYNGYYEKHRLKGGVLAPNQHLRIISLMHNGVVYVDGSHLKYPLRFGAEMILKKSNELLKVVMP